jgi:hypothetical protein
MVCAKCSTWRRGDRGGWRQAQVDDGASGRRALQSRHRACGGMAWCCALARGDLVGSGTHAHWTGHNTVEISLVCALRRVVRTRARRWLLRIGRASAARSKWERIEENDQWVGLGARPACWLRLGPFSFFHLFSKYSISFKSFKLAITKQDLPIAPNLACW